MLEGLKLVPFLSVPYGPLMAPMPQAGPRALKCALHYFMGLGGKV